MRFNDMIKRERLRKSEIELGCDSFVLGGLVFNKIGKNSTNWYRGWDMTVYYQTSDGVHEIRVEYGYDGMDEYDEGGDFLGAVYLDVNTKYGIFHKEWECFERDEFPQVLNDIWVEYKEEYFKAIVEMFPKRIEHTWGELELDYYDYDGGDEPYLRYNPSENVEFVFVRWEKL